MNERVKELAQKAFDEIKRRSDLETDWMNPEDLACYLEPIEEAIATGITEVSEKGMNNE